MEKKFLISKKYHISIYLIIFFILIICKNNNFFKNFYDLIYQDHNKRQQSAYGFCNQFGTGYVFYVKEKFDLKTAPLIKNYLKAPEQYWIFKDSYKILDKDKLIVLNKKKDIQADFSEYKVLDNFNDSCLLLEKK